MSAARRLLTPCPARRARGFTLVELMVTVAIALFLLAGLVTVVENTRITYGNQQALAQLQDQQRFAMSVITSVIEAGGYYNNPTGDTQNSALPAAPNFGSGQPFWGTGNANPAPGDTLYVRFRTAQNDGIINCSGGQNTTFNPDHVYTNELYVNAPTGQLMCLLVGEGTPAVPLVNGLVNLQIYYGVKRNPPLDSDYNVDTYVTAANMVGTPGTCNGTLAPGCDWQQVSAVRVVLTFTNPLFGQAGQQQPTLQFERVIEVMARAGDHT
jgi:type IV pilus assembly protein PilW